MSIEELIGKLEQARGPDRELDLECWWWGKANHDGTQPMGPQYKADNLRMNDAPRYTASLDSALTLIKGMYCIFAMEFPSVKYLPANADGGFMGANVIDVPVHSTVPIALCIAALKARTSMESNHE